jgi:hypothetical protein
MQTPAPAPAVDAIIGVGGGGGWLCQLRAKSEGHPVILIDGDIVTESNLNRQFYLKLDVGRMKILRMKKFLSDQGVPCDAFAEYIYHDSGSWNALLADPRLLRLFVCVDNHVARRACLELADDRHAAGLPTVTVIAGNEYSTASADAYLPEWRDTALDFRVRYPEVLTDQTGDPLSPPCTGEVLRSKPQLALSNSLAAFTAAWLMDVWTVSVPACRGSDLFDAILEKSPVSVQWTDSGQRTLSVAALRGQ